MNNELMRDENFIRCSTMVAELLMKYKSKEMELGEESKVTTYGLLLRKTAKISALYGCEEDETYNRRNMRERLAFSEGQCYNG